MQLSDIKKPFQKLCAIAGLDELIVVRKQASQLEIVLLSCTSKYFLPDYSPEKNFSVKARLAVPVAEDPSNAKARVQAFLKEHQADSDFVIGLTDDYKCHFISIPADNEGNDTWLNENYSKFLPPSVNLDDFSFVFEELIKDENSIQCEMIMSRKDELAAFHSCLRDHALDPVAILPSRCFFPSAFADSDGPSLLLAAFPDRLEFLFKDETKALRESFQLQTDTSTGGSQNLRNRELEGRINDIRQLIFSNQQTNDAGALHILAWGVPEDKQIFESSFALSANNNSRKMYFVPDYDCIIPARDFLLHPNSDLNLLSPADLLPARDKLEKQYASRMFLALCGGIFILLLLLNAMYFIFSRLNDSASEVQSESAELSRMLDLMKKENSAIEAETTSLINMQHRSDDISALMASLAGAIPGDCALSSLDLQCDKERTYSVTLKGVGFSQEKIGEFISALNRIRGMKDIHLLGSTQADENALRRIDDDYPDVAVPETIFQFTMTLQYAASDH